MPLFRAGHQLHFYAHVPKCGGQSIESYLQERFGTLAFLNNQFYLGQPTERWTRSSPQHVDLRTLYTLMPKDWIASSFAVVRHPVARLVSSYHFGLLVNDTIPSGFSIELWFNEYKKMRHAHPYYLDNHLRPQTDLVPADAAIFRLEDHLDSLVSHLDRITGNTFGPRALPHVNRTESDAPFRRAPLRPAFIRDVESYYAADFNRFGFAHGAMDHLDVYDTNSGAPKSKHAHRLLERRLLRPFARLTLAGTRRLGQRNCLF